jgi:hypothetical protein
MGFGLPTILYLDNNLLISVRRRTLGIWPASATILCKSPYKNPCAWKNDSVSSVLPISFFLFPIALSIIPLFCQYLFGCFFHENQVAR